MDAILCTLPRWPGRAELRHRHPARTQSISIEARTRELFSAPASRPPGASTGRLPFRNELPAAHAGGVDRCELHPLRLPGWSVRVGRGSGTVGLVARRGADGARHLGKPTLEDRSRVRQDARMIYNTEIFEVSDVGEFTRALERLRGPMTE